MISHERTNKPLHFEIKKKTHLLTTNETLQLQVVQITKQLSKLGVVYTMYRQITRSVGVWVWYSICSDCVKE